MSRVIRSFTAAVVAASFMGLGAVAWALLRQMRKGGSPGP